MEIFIGVIIGGIVFGILVLGFCKAAADDEQKNDGYYYDLINDSQPDNDED